MSKLAHSNQKTMDEIEAKYQEQEEPPTMPAPLKSHATESEAARVTRLPNENESVCLLTLNAERYGYTAI